MTKPGYALGSIEGRISYNLIPEQFASETFSFRCHRKEPTGPKTSPPKSTAIFGTLSEPCPCWLAIEMTF